MNSNENNKEYEIIDLYKEYPGFTGGCHFAVITELTPEAFRKKYNGELGALSSCLFLSKDQGEVFKEFDRNESKHRMRRIRSCSLDGYVEGETEYIYSVFSKDEPEDIAIQLEEMAAIRKSVESLTEVQRRRLKLYFYNGLTVREIAELEGVSHKNVLKSLNEAIRKIKKFQK